MKRFLWITICLLWGLCVSVLAQKKEAKFLIDGLFFSEAPSELDGRKYALSILENDKGEKLFLITGLKLSEKARSYALPESEVPDAGYWLEQAKNTTKFFQMSDTKQPETALKVGDKIKTFQVKDTEGGMWNNQSTLGKPLVLNFWYTGCGPCIREMPELSAWVDAFPEVNFLAVTWNSAQDIKLIIERKGFRFVQVASDETLWKMFGVQQTPTTVVLDKEGVVRKIVYGTNQQKRDELRECIKSLIINH